MTDPKDIRSITDNDFPAAYRISDHASMSAQRNYQRLFRGNLVLIIVGVIATSWAIQAVSFRTLLAIVAAIALFLGALLTIAMAVFELEKVWFGARALAESIKTTVWRYMTRAEPFGLALDGKQADELLCKKIDSIFQERRYLGKSLASVEASTNQITDYIYKLRDQDLITRKSIYLRDRIKNQLTWYAKKSEANRKSATLWLVIIFICQGLAATAAILLVQWPTFDFNFAAVFSGLAGVLLAWLQVKRHQDLAHSYTLASTDLGLILALEKHVLIEEDFSVFVADAENAISREHTMWLARRDAL